MLFGLLLGVDRNALEEDRQAKKEECIHGRVSLMPEERRKHSVEEQAVAQNGQEVSHFHPRTWSGPLFTLTLCKKSKVSPVL